ncbi:MAG: hypothetical protein JEY94_16945 [Melioribacteraceae bacterium]|nr:hypothetical protein [Melioribacteraceae bacterium]
MQTNLRDLDEDLKKILIMYILVLSIGVILGLLYVSNLTESSSKGIVNNIKGDEQFKDEFTENIDTGKTVNSLLMTTHNHILGFAFIFLSITLIFNYNTVIKGKFKKFLLLEPFISIILTFGSFWLIKFVNPNFYMLTIISAVILYASYFIMAGVSLFDLVKTR